MVCILYVANSFLSNFKEFVSQFRHITKECKRF